MEIVNVTFRKVSKIRYQRDRHFPVQTDFCFERNGRKIRATVPVLAEIQEGQTVTAVLQDADDWRTLLGWIDQKTGVVTAPDYRTRFFEVWLSVSMVIASLLALCLTRPSQNNGAGVVFFIALCFFCGAILNYKSGYRRREAVACLRAIKRRTKYIPLRRPILPRPSHIETVTFKNIDEIESFGIGTPQRKRLEFVAYIDGLRQNVVLFGSLPKLGKDLTVTTLMGAPKQWNTLWGWVDHGTGEVVAPDSSVPFTIAATLILSTAFSAYIAQILMPYWRPLSIGLLVSPLLAGSAFLIAEGICLQRITLQLKKLSAQTKAATV